jgi:hypothetical protein
VGVPDVTWDQKAAFVLIPIMKLKAFSSDGNCTLQKILVTKGTTEDWTEQEGL